MFNINHCQISLAISMLILSVAPISFLIIALLFYFSFPLLIDFPNSLSFSGRRLQAVIGL